MRHLSPIRKDQFRLNKILNSQFKLSNHTLADRTAELIQINLLASSKININTNLQSTFEPALKKLQVRSLLLR